MRNSKEKVRKNWVFSLFKWTAIAAVALLVLCMMAEFNYDNKLRREARRVSIVTGIPYEYLYEEGDIYNTIDLDVLRGIEKDYYSGLWDQEEERINTAEHEREIEKRIAESKRISEERRAESKARSEASWAAYNAEYEETRQRIEAELQAHIDEYNASAASQSTESYYDLTHDKEEYIPENYDDILAALNIGNNDQTAADETQAYTFSEERNEPEDKEPPEPEQDGIRQTTNTATSNGSPFDEIHVGDQYKQNIYYNPQGTRIQGIDEINFVNDPYHK